jgi:[ribosomal protein S5]-alanine N-acetyltransferase
MLLHNLTTERLRFRNLELADAIIWEEFLGNSEAVKFFPPVTDIKQGAVAWVEKTFNRYATDGFGLYALLEKNTNTFVGQCGLMMQEVDGIPELEIGYHLLPRFWKLGYAAEAAIASRNFAFENHLADSIISIIVPENFPSQKVAEKNGMKKERETEWRGTKVFIYRITRDEWMKIRE